MSVRKRRQKCWRFLILHFYWSFSSDTAVKVLTDTPRLTHFFVCLFLSLYASSIRENLRTQLFSDVYTNICLLCSTTSYVFFCRWLDLQIQELIKLTICNSLCRSGKPECSWLFQWPVAEARYSVTTTFNGHATEVDERARLKPSAPAVPECSRFFWVWHQMCSHFLNSPNYTVTF